MSNNHNASHGSTDDTLILIGVLCVGIPLLVFGGWKIGKVAIITITRNVYGLIELPFYYLQLFIQKITGSNAGYLDFTTNAITKLCYPDPNHAMNPLMHCTANLKVVPFSFYSENCIFPTILIGALLVGWIWYKHAINLKYLPDTRYVQEHDLESLIGELGSYQPHLRYIQRFIQSNYATDKGFYRLLLSPREFIKIHNLVYGFRKYEIENAEDFDDFKGSNSPKDDAYPLLDQSKFEKLMMHQLGQMLDKPSNLSDGEIILYALFLPMACATDERMSDKEFKKIKAQKDMLLHYFWDKAIEHLTSEKAFINPKNYEPREFKYFERKRLQKIVERYWNHPVAKEVFSKHAYVRTALIALIYKTRTLGVLAPCELRWLRNYDRTLWALVQNVGRPSVYVEQLAAFSHYTSEAYYHRRKISPDFSYGWNGLLESLKQYRYADPHVYLPAPPKANEITV
ncbi:TPA: hypothetical protein JIE93_003271, partial [Acinetobacter baumannii]